MGYYPKEHRIQEMLDSAPGWGHVHSPVDTAAAAQVDIPNPSVSLRALELNLISESVHRLVDLSDVNASVELEPEPRVEPVGLNLEVALEEASLREEPGNLSASEHLLHNTSTAQLEPHNQSQVVDEHSSQVTQPHAETTTLESTVQQCHFFPEGSNTEPRGLDEQIPGNSPNSPDMHNISDQPEPLRPPAATAAGSSEPTVLPQTSSQRTHLMPSDLGQRLPRPFTKHTMEALQVLVEEGNKSKGKKKSKVVPSPTLDQPAMVA
ncbi:unnamed protein product [Urochloa humidicola]